MDPAIAKWLIFAGVIVAVGVVLWLSSRFLAKRSGKLTAKRFSGQLTMLGLTAVGILVVIVALPDATTRDGLLKLYGVLFSAVIALSSATILGNAMGGIMLRVVRNFRTGDFIRTNEHFGRVSERGLFHVEIQTQDRELTTLPNLYLATHPVTVTRSSGAIVAATVSLGYDVSRRKIEKLLLKAAEAAEFKDPFVHVIELGDFSVSYRVCGLLEEVKQLISARSRLRSSVLDALHDDGVEIVSPSFMNQRVVDPGQKFIPRPDRIVTAEESASVVAEELVFDKAEEAASIESLKVDFESLVSELTQLQGEIKKTEDEAERAKLERKVAVMTIRRERLERVIAARTIAASEQD